MLISLLIGELLLWASLCVELEWEPLCCLPSWNGPYSGGSPGSVWAIRSLTSFVPRWGWRGALQGLATLCLGSIAFGAAMFPAPNQAESSEEQQEVNSEQAEPVACRGWRWLLSWLVGSSLASSPTLPLFLMVMLGDFLATMSLTIPYTFLPAMAVAQGISAQDAAFLISAAGISSTVRRCFILDNLFSDFFCSTGQVPFFKPLFLSE